MWENDLIWKWGEYTIIIYDFMSNSIQLCANRWSQMDDQNEATYISETWLLCQMPDLLVLDTCVLHALNTIF